MKKRIASVLFLACCTIARGDIVLSFEPLSTTALVGQTVSVDVFVSGLRTAPLDLSVGSFALSIGYNSAVVSPVGVAFGSSLGNPMFEAITDTLPFPEVNFAEVSLLDATDLYLRQANRIVLATLSFDVVGLGTSPLEFSTATVTDAAFGELLILELGRGSITGVPEPAAVILLVTVIGTLGFTVRANLRRRSDHAT